MKITQVLFLAFVCLLSSCKSSDSPITTVYQLIDRVTPGYSRQYCLELMPAKDSLDCYEIGQRHGKVLLRGNNPVALATAYNQYLKKFCKAHVSWMGNQLNLPEQLPLPENKVTNTINGKYRVYMNYCTLSYSAAWWNWERWQRELDFMAMNSINMPLSVVGIEAVWYNTLLKYNFSDEEARRFLAGPGHAAWQWMQNIQSYGGPLPKSWIDKQIRLGKQIMQRELELGMHPIQQGFSGYVPREMKAKYPEAKIRLQPSWCAFKGAAQLDPTDSLFTQFGRSFLEEEKKLFGAHGFYAADPFHESAPPIRTKEYLHEVGCSIDQLFKTFDPHSTWVMQAWSLREDIVKAVPKHRLLILDLNGSRSTKENAVWGYPLIAGNLHNFGGRVNLHGDLLLVASNQYKTAVEKSPNVCGSGLFMECIEQNPIFYDLAFEMPLHHDKVNLDEWLKAYVERRYGTPIAHTNAAWQLLLKGPYAPGTNGTERSSIIAARPALNVKKSGPNTGLGIPYAPQLVIEAEGLLLQDSEQLQHSDAYRFDIVDVQRQLMTNLGQVIHKAAAAAFLAKDKEAFALHSSRFLQLLKDVDELLRTRKEFNFDRWLSDARANGTTEAERNLYEKDATALVTIWGADGDPLIFDYSWREWTGLIEGYYLKRWEKFYAMLQEHLDHGTEYQEKGLRLTHGREAFRANKFYSDLGDWELNFVATPNKQRTPITQGDEVAVARRMYAKYLVMSKEYYGDATSADKISHEENYENLGETPAKKK